MRNILIATAFFFSFSFTLSAQITAIWQGVKPGQATNWNCSANWSNGRVPDEFTQVIIPANAHAYPVIQGNPTPIDALLVEDGAKLSIESASTLTILGETGIFDGITLLGRIENKGTLGIGEALNLNTASLKQVQGKGKVLSPSTYADSMKKRK